MLSLKLLGSVLVPFLISITTLKWSRSTRKTERRNIFRLEIELFVVKRHGDPSTAKSIKESLKISKWRKFSAEILMAPAMIGHFMGVILILAILCPVEFAKWLGRNFKVMHWNKENQYYAS